MSRVIASMIGRNEADRYLEEVLDALQEHVDAIVFTDDGSEDSTFLMARDAGAYTIRLSDSLFEENEGKLREISWEHLTKIARHGDWILSIDCDEKLFAPDDLHKLIEETSASVMMATFYHMWDDTHYRVDKAWKPDQQPRLFKYHKEGHVMQRALACGQYPTYVKQMVRDGKVADPGLKMQHLGYLSDEDKLMKFERYMRIDGGKYHSLRHLESIVDPNPTLEKWDVHVERG